MEQEDSSRERLHARIEEWRRRPMRLHDDVITSAHGAGGKASQALLNSVIFPAFEMVGAAMDGAVLKCDPDHDLVVTTDSFVVTPRRFPGGSIARLAVNGSINDLAVMGATPRWMTVAFVIEEGFEIQEFRELVAELALAALDAGVAIVTGDTKVVGRGAADGIYVTTTGVGTRARHIKIDPGAVRAGDSVIVSGTLGDHGIAVLQARGELDISSNITSDCAPLHTLVEALLTSGANTRWMRDPTRGGVASSLNELAMDTELGVRLNETSLPISRTVRGVCELLGLDPLYVANEGKLLAVVSSETADTALEALKAHPFGRDSAVIGEITSENPGIVVLETLFGGTRVVDMLVGDPLPRIC
ncbi:MAG: hydrogenase expression/formation protein HypE [Ilumatobacteraceae bacterium]